MLGNRLLTKDSVERPIEQPPKVKAECDFPPDLRGTAAPVRTLGISSQRHLQGCRSPTRSESYTGHKLRLCVTVGKPGTSSVRFLNLPHLHKTMEVTLLLHKPQETKQRERGEENASVVNWASLAKKDYFLNEPFTLPDPIQL